MRTARRTVSGNAGGYARTKAHEYDLAHLRANRYHWLRLAVLLTLPAVGLYSVYIITGIAGGAFTTGVYTGAIGVSVVHELRIRSGSAPIHRGADTEQMVDEVLRESAPPGWQVRSAVSFADGDIDHVLVGDTTVIMVETKSTHTNWRLTDNGVTLNGTDPTIRARKSLGRARRLVTGGKSTGIDGQAWLVLHSPHDAERDAQLPTVRGDVHVLKPWHLADAVAVLPPIVDFDRVAANVARVDKLIGDRRTHEQRVWAAAH